MDFLLSIGLDDYILKVLIINICITLTLIASIPLISGAIFEIESTKELAKKDNLAFGISIGGIILGLAIIMTGIVAGQLNEDLLEETVLIGCYGLLGIMLMLISRYIFDKISLKGLSLSKEILRGNVAAGILDAGNAIATSFIIHSSMVWVDSTSRDGLLIVVIAYLLSQALFMLATWYRLKLYSFLNSGKKLIDSLNSGNKARALIFAGYRISVAFAIVGATTLVPYDITEIYDTVIKWLLISISLIIILSLLAVIGEKFILYKINLKQEIDVNQNIAVATINFIIYIAIGLLLANLIW